MTRWEPRNRQKPRAEKLSLDERRRRNAARMRARYICKGDPGYVRKGGAHYVRKGGWGGVRVKRTAAA